MSLLHEKLPYALHFGHLLVFAIWVGIQFWVHVSGFTMFKTLTRNAFAQVQSKIFPLYFMSGIALCLSVSLLCSLVNYFYLGPETIRMMLIKAQRVTFLGIEDGVGPIAPKLVEHDLTYKEIKEKFIKLHAACSIVNMICFGACGVNVWCLACKQVLC
ncbi:transmembrane protein 205-like [Dendronephthya gigantea]|uniref:transmembrane protein 205-like n=1 Tax=Dendronephthya gigantea TaxID=151771 RepID=UPI00106D1A48|nr:transmembrane protein 205-like [Dendronephthya gigantea]